MRVPLFGGPTLQVPPKGSIQMNYNMGVQDSSAEHGKTTARPLPGFESPPINEVVCGVQFKHLERWKTAHFGAFWWDKARNEYPEVEDHPPLPYQADPVTGSVPGGSPPKIGEGSLLPLRRVWLVDPTGRYLMQVDPPRFLHNWRKMADTDPYPRFEEAYRRFTTAFDLYRSFVEELSLGDLSPNLYELTYINHILAEEAEFPERMGRFLNFYRWEPSGAFLAQPEGFESKIAVPLPEKAGKLTISVAHGTRKSDEKPVLVLDLTARGAATMSMDEWFGIAHETIVRGGACQAL